MSQPIPEWRGSSRGWLSQTLVATLAVYFALRSDLWAMYLVAFIMILVVHTLTSVYVRIDEEELTYGFGSWMWPKRTFPLTQIDRVEVATIQPLRYGGWGLRGSRHAIARRGPGIIVHLRGGGDAVITVDDAEGAAAHIARQTTINA